MPRAPKPSKIKTGIFANDCKKKLGTLCPGCIVGVMKNQIVVKPAQIVEVSTGQIRNVFIGEVPAWNNQTQTRYWAESELTKNGTPDGRKPGAVVGVSWGQFGRQGYAAYYLPEREETANVIRAEISEIKKALKLAEEKLTRVYEDGTAID
jgi:hypothetical protein